MDFSYKYPKTQEKKYQFKKKIQSNSLKMPRLACLILVAFCISASLAEETPWKQRMLTFAGMQIILYFFFNASTFKREAIKYFRTT